MFRLYMKCHIKSHAALRKTLWCSYIIRVPVFTWKSMHMYCMCVYILYVLLNSCARARAHTYSQIGQQQMEKGVHNNEKKNINEIDCYNFMIFLCCHCVLLSIYYDKYQHYWSVGGGRDACICAVRFPFCAKLNRILV